MRKILIIFGTTQIITTLTITIVSCNNSKQEEKKSEQEWKYEKNGSIYQAIETIETLKNINKNQIIIVSFWIGSDKNELIKTQKYYNEKQEEENLTNNIFLWNCDGYNLLGRILNTKIPTQNIIFKKLSENLKKINNKNKNNYYITFNFIKIDEKEETYNIFPSNPVLLKMKDNNYEAGLILKTNNESYINTNFIVGIIVGSFFVLISIIIIIISIYKYKKVR